MKLPTPRIVHFIFGMRLNNGEVRSDKPFSLIHGLALLSASIIIRPDKMILWYDDDSCLGNHTVKQLIDIGKLEVRHVDTPTEVLDPAGIKPPKKITQVEHAADVLRLEILWKFGGIYLDCDTLSVLPLDDLIARKRCILTREGDDGICNAIIITPARNYFIKEWRIAYYDGFDPEGWGEASVQLPWQLGMRRPWEVWEPHVQVQDQSTFFWPDWSRAGLELLFDYCPQGNAIPARILHLWEKVSWNPYNLGKLTTKDIQEGKGLYHECARRFVTQG